MFLKYYLFLIEIVLIVSIFLRRNNNIVRSLFLGFIVFTLLTEVTAIGLAEKYDVNNLWLYNTYLVISFLCWYYWFAYKAGLRKQAAFVACFYFSFAMADFFFFQKPMTLNSYSYIAGTFGYASLFIVWIYNIIKKEKYFTDSATLLFFTAGLGYYTGFTVDIVLYPTGILNEEVFKGVTLDMLLVNAVNTFFYGMLSLSIVVGYYNGNIIAIKKTGLEDLTNFADRTKN